MQRQHTYNLTLEPPKSPFSEDLSGGEYRKEPREKPNCPEAEMQGETLKSFRGGGKKSPTAGHQEACLGVPWVHCFKKLL